MSFRISLVLKAFVVATFTFVSCIRSQDTTLAGWTFSQFLGEGAPQINAETFESTGSIVATYGGNINPVSAEVDGTVVINNSGTGYTNASIGTWSFGAFDINNADDVRADTFGALNTINSMTLDGKQMHLTDSAGMMLTFRKTTTLWNIQVANTAGYTNASANDFTFAARGNDGAATVEWFFNDQLFSTTTVTAGSFNVYSAELPSQFYGNGSIQGRLVSGMVSFDNVQINGQRGNPPQFTQQPVSLVKVVGQSATFSVNVSGATEPTYQWFKGVDAISGANQSSYTLVSVALGDTASYRVIVRSSNGLSAESNFANLEVRQAPSIIRAPATQSANPGQTITFSVLASGNPKPDFRWQRNGIDLIDGASFSGVTTDTLKISGVVDADAGDYRVVVSNIVDSVSSATAQLTVNSLAIAPTVTTDPIDLVEVQGGRAEFFVIASGAPSPTYRWQFNGANLVDGPGISGASTDRLILEGLSPSRAGTYSVIIENSEGFVKREADLTVQVPPSIISGPGPESRFVAAGSEVVYSVSVGGDPLPSIQWLRNGEPLEGRTLSTLALPSVTVIDEGVYSVRLTNAAGSIVSSGSELKVGSGARIISSPRSSIGAIGESVTFTVVADGNPLPAFQWFRNGNALPESYGSDSSLTLSNLSSADAGIYTVQVYNQFGTVTSESAELRVAQPVSVTRPNQVQTFAPGSTLVFGSPGNPSNPLRYEWYRDGKRLGGANASQLSLASASFSDSGVYSVKIFNSKGKLVASRVVARVAVSVANGFDVLLRDRTSGDPAGIVRLDIARAGAFTGRLQLLDGSVHSIRGALKFTDQFTSGQATVNVRRKGAASLTLVLDLDPHSAQFGCALGEGELIIATGSAERRFTGTANWAGFYTLTLSASGSSSSILDATVAKSGVLRLSGSLTDGSRVTFFGPASIAASYPILMLPYRKGTGYLVGELGLVSSADGYFADEESSDLWIWRRPSNGSPLVGALSPMLTP